MKIQPGKETLMMPSERFPGRHCLILLAGVLALGLAACGDKPAPKAAAKPIPPATQAEPKKDEIKMAAPAKPKVDPDSDLAAKVKDALGADGGVNVHRIDVAASQGVITLYGTADDAAQREKVERISAGVAGVKSVKNKLAIVAGS
jgi:hyperosmotically inducible periplasmic protein